MGCCYSAVPCICINGLLLLCRFIADNQMHQSCLLFVETCGPRIVERCLCRNFLLHLVSMHDFNLINLNTIDKVMARLGELQQKLQRDHLALKLRQEAAADGQLNSEDSGAALRDKATSTDILSSGVTKQSKRHKL